MYITQYTHMCIYTHQCRLCQHACTGMNTHTQGTRREIRPSCKRGKRWQMRADLSTPSWGCTVTRWGNWNWYYPEEKSNKLYPFYVTRCHQHLKCKLYVYMLCNCLWKLLQHWNMKEIGRTLTYDCNMLYYTAFILPYQRHMCGYKAHI